MDTVVDAICDRHGGTVLDFAHQLRNPLAALRLRVEALEPLIVESGRGQYAAAVEDMHHLSRIVDELLVLARAQACPTAVGRVDVAAVVEHRVEAWRRWAAQRHITMTTGCRPVLATAAAGTVDQVLDVFLDNALHAAPAGSTVTVHCSAGRRWAEIHVIDQGPGMSRRERRRATDRFWRGRTSAAAYHGLGLGLSIAAALLHASGGHLRLRAAPGRGLDATARLPIPGR